EEGSSVSYGPESFVDRHTSERVASRFDRSRQASDSRTPAATPLEEIATVVRRRLAERFADGDRVSRDRNARGFAGEAGRQRRNARRSRIRRKSLQLSGFGRTAGARSQAHGLHSCATRTSCEAALFIGGVGFATDNEELTSESARRPSFGPSERRLDAAP